VNAKPTILILAVFLFFSCSPFYEQESHQSGPRQYFGKVCRTLNGFEKSSILLVEVDSLAECNSAKGEARIRAVFLPETGSSDYKEELFRVGPSTQSRSSS